MLRRSALIGFMVAVTALIAIAISPAAAQDQTVDVELGDFYIEMPSSVQAGTITFSMSNVGAMPHTITIEGNGVDVSGDVLSGGQSGTLEVELAAGSYTVYCPIPGHREGGMELTLTVIGQTAPTATVSAPTATVSAPTATTGTGPTATTGVAATATSLPDVPRTGSGGSAGVDAGTTGVLLLLVAIIGIGVAGALAYRSQR
ncbi:MAG TPA: sulfocyanin-like copper-binding protein [Thermomicrobiales bacterium]|nr:sulfocyanin-like copper-binding protein [Thermomicrobiales bacterium]